MHNIAHRSYNSSLVLQKSNTKKQLSFPIGTFVVPTAARITYCLRPIACNALEVGSRRSDPANGNRLFDESSDIREVTVQEAEKLYTSLPERTNDKHVMLVMYTTSCKSMQPEVQRLADGLPHDELSILALDCSAPAAQYFIKNVLGVSGLPAFCIFPKFSRTFYKFKGSSYDANTLLKFLNMVCNHNSDQLWKLPEPVVPALEPKPMAVAEVRKSAPEPIQQQQQVGITQEPAPSSSALAGAAPASAVMTFAGVAGCLAISAAMLFLVKRQQQQKEQQVEQGSSNSSAETNADAVVTLSSAPSSPTVPLVPRLITEIDDAMGSLGNVMLKLVRARVGLVVAPAQDPAVAPAVIGNITQDVIVDVDAKALDLDQQTAAPTAALHEALLSTSAGDATFSVEPVEKQSTGNMAAAWPGQNQALHDLTSVTANYGSAESDLLPGQGLESGLTQEMYKVSGVSADQVLALLEEEGEDVGRAIQRLLQQQDVHVQVDTIKPPPQQE